MTLPEGMTAEKLRDIADWLDLYDRLAESYINLIESIGRTPASADVEATIAVVRGEEVQNDLRHWADAIDWEDV